MFCVLQNLHIDSEKVRLYQRQFQDRCFWQKIQRDQAIRAGRHGYQTPTTSFQIHSLTDSLVSDYFSWELRMLGQGHLSTGASSN